MIALSVAKLRMFSPEKKNFSLNKAKKEKKILWKVWFNADLLEIREKARNAFFL